MPVFGQVLRLREAASHADYCYVVLIRRDGCWRFRRRRLCRRGGRAAVKLAEFLCQVTGKRGDVGVIEDGGIGDDQLARECAVEPISQLHGHQRVHAQIEEAHRRGGRAWQPHHRLQLLLQERHQYALCIDLLRALQLSQQVFR